MGKDPGSANLQCRISRDLEGLSARKKYAIPYGAYDASKILVIIANICLI